MAPSDISRTERTLAWAMRVNPSKERRNLSALATRYPGASRRELSAKVVRRSRMWGVGVGAATGVVSIPWVAVPAGVADVWGLLRVQLVMAQRIGLLYQPSLLDSGEPAYEVLIPILGKAAVEAFQRDMGAGDTKGLTRAALKGYVRREGFMQLKKLLLKQLGKKVAQKGFVAKSIPIMGGLVSGGWNYMEVTAAGKRVIRYFEGKEID